MVNLPATGESQSVTVPVVVVEKSDLDIGEELGGEVYKARWNSRNKTVAIKRLTGRLEDGEVGLPPFLQKVNNHFCHFPCMSRLLNWNLCATRTLYASMEL